MSVFSYVAANLHAATVSEIPRAVLSLSEINPTGSSLRNSGESDSDGEGTFDQQIELRIKVRSFVEGTKWGARGHGDNEVFTCWRIFEFIVKFEPVSRGQTERKYI